MVGTNQELFRTLEALVNDWCDRKCLTALRSILPAYPMPSPLTDGWAELLIALQNVRASARNETTPDEKILLDKCILSIDTMLRNK